MLKLLTENAQFIITKKSIDTSLTPLQEWSVELVNRSEQKSLKSKLRDI